MHWPQITMIVLLTMSATIHLIKHGKPADVKFNFPLSCVRGAILIGILYAGGFFS